MIPSPRPPNGVALIRSTAELRPKAQKSVLRRVTSNALVLSIALFAGMASAACDPNGWDPVAYEFCDNADAPVFPYGVPTFEIRNDAGYARVYLRDGTRAVLDLAQGTVTIVYPNGASEFGQVGQLSTEAQTQFWALAHQAANNPQEHFLVPLDHLSAVATRVVASGAAVPQTTVARGLGVGYDESNCDDGGASGNPPNTLPCVQVRAQLMYWNVITDDWSQAPSIRDIPAGAIRCHLPTVDACNIWANNQRIAWEERRQQACSDRWWDGGLFLATSAAAHVGCQVAGAGVGATATGAGAAPGALAIGGGGILCVGGIVGALHAGRSMWNNNATCTSSFPGPR
ncbi:hypothetical protein GCM10028794_21950 [Silanimonas algicola]